MQENNTKKYDVSLIYAIVGVAILIVAVAGSAFAYYNASATATINGKAGGGDPILTVTKVSTGASGSLIPIDMNNTTLSNGAKGWHPTTSGVYGGAGSINTAWNPTEACRDKYGYSVCQIYSVTLKNNAGYAQSFNIGVTSLAGVNTPDNTPNVETVNMASNISVTNATSIKGSTTGIASNVALNAGATSLTYYFMVFIKNTTAAQTDNGNFTGTVTATSSTGAEFKARFS